jgi:hypothetical protein
MRPRPIALLLTALARAAQLVQQPGTDALRHLYAMAEISRLKRQADVQVRIVSIPGEWVPPVPGVFITETMNNLADLGTKMGADPASWSNQPPGF